MSSGVGCYLDVCPGVVAFSGCITSETVFDPRLCLFQGDVFSLLPASLSSSPELSSRSLPLHWAPLLPGTGTVHPLDFRFLPPEPVITMPHVVSELLRDVLGERVKSGPPRPYLSISQKR
ncbi:hypothetical protein DSO57_1017671 [Entomophthora muscae]|uniref:Uncharacterized protein n=1 Tax=Entomophthora muscae TaxID=34485 RepID=A0ACC2SHV6_9FUNG|nr:hypothetical protein DSO57_1017671 [Entomophthora muscae]